MTGSGPDSLTPAQQELYDWLADYIGTHHHSPSIRQMMQAMGLRSPAPIQSRLRHLQQKGWITWQEGQARTLQLLGGIVGGGIPVLGAVAAGGLVETFDDVEERLDLRSVLETRGLFALTVNGDSHLSLASAWRPDHPVPTKAAQAYRNQCWGNDDQIGIEKMLSTGERN